MPCPFTEDREVYLKCAAEMYGRAEPDAINNSTKAVQMFQEDIPLLTLMTPEAIDQMNAIGILAIAVPILAGISVYIFYKKRKKVIKY